MRQYSIREQFAQDIAQLISFCTSKEWGVTLGEAYRTEEQQAIYLASGKSKVAVSQHQKRLAIDLHIWSKDKPSEYISDNEWREAGEFWELLAQDNRWGGRFGLSPQEYSTKIGWDAIHFERKS